MIEGSRIVIDALAARREGGAAHIAIEIASRLAHSGGVASVVLVTHADSVVARSVARSPQLRVVELRSPRRLELALRIAWEYGKLRKILASGGSLLSMSGMLPRRVDANVVSYLMNSTVFEGGGLANAVRRRAVRRTSAFAQHVITPSRAMRELVVPTVGERAHVVPLGVDHDRFRPTDRLGQSILYVADFYQHKRHDLVLEAWSRLSPPRPRLDFVGDQHVDERHARSVEDAIRARRQLGEIRLRSRLSTDELVATYQGARLMIVTSDRESFCLPVIEANACGVPVVARDIAALRETGGQASVYVRDDDPRSWSTAMASLLVDDDSYRRCRNRALSNAALYSWDRTVAELRDLLVG